MSDQVTDEATRVFVDHRELLFSVVYNLLGSAADTDDVLQETWLSWAAAARSRCRSRTRAPTSCGSPSTRL